MQGCCGCCSALRPRYKRLVDSIFPVNPQDGLVRNNMEKLTFYALSSPEKLDRIGEYLAHRVSRDISRHRIGFVVIAMEALDQLLIACHAQTLNLFVESYLKMVQKLLECHEPQLQILATQSFVKFAHIEEDTPSYHRRYDFFVSKFSSMCHNNHNNTEIRQQLRLSGLKGLQGVVRKTVSDDLQVNIWEQAHMDKIVPSLIFNMQETKDSLTPLDASDHAIEEQTLNSVAESCLRELTGRGTFGNIPAILKPALKHFDYHKLWVPNNFAVHAFKVIMYSIQAQYSYAVIQMLMSHLDDNSKADAKIRTGIAGVLAQIINIAAGESVGPSVLEIINSLLSHLRQSIARTNLSPEQAEDEQLFQETVINTLGEFAQNLPDYQKVEIMMFILGKVPPPMGGTEKPNAEGDVLLQNMLLKSVLKVATKYTTVHMVTALPVAFLDPLLKMSVASDPEVRLIVQQILHTLLDRHENMEKLHKPSIQELDLTVEKCSRQDMLFMKKHGHEIFLHIYDNMCFPNNRSENSDALYCTLALLCVEVGSEEALMDMLRLTLALQEMALTNNGIYDEQRYAIHHIVASYLNLIGQLTAVPEMCQHIEKVIKARQSQAPYLLPEGSAAPSTAQADLIPEHLLFDKNTISDALRNCSHDVSRLLMPFVPRQAGPEPSAVTHSVSDLNSISVEVDSVASSPGVTRKHPGEEITVESLKKLLAEPSDAHRQAEEERRMQILEKFRTAAFEDLVARTESKTEALHNKLNEIFCKLAPSSLEHRPPGSPLPPSKLEECHKQATPPSVYEIQFPELFVF